MAKSITIKPEFFATNRQRLAAAIGDDAIAIIDTAPVLRRRGDFEYPFRPDSNFYYLSGIAEPEAVLVLVPGHANPAARALLFISGTSDHVGLWEGDRHTPESAAKASGIETVLPLTELDAYLSRLFERFQKVYLNAEPSLEPSAQPAVVRAARLRTLAPTLTLKSALPVLDDMRIIKTPGEVELIRRAIAITEAGLERVRQAFMNARNERELKAELAHEYVGSGAAESFGAIVAAGRRATIIHYAAGNQPISPGDSVLVDTGAEYGFYAADLTRTFLPKEPSARQRAVWQAVHDAQAAGIAATRPGVSIVDIDAVMRDSLQSSIRELGLKGELSHYYPHISHHLGLDVHDPGSPRRALEPGMVITCEPGLYLRNEGIGVRLEDDLLVTSDGFELLSKTQEMW